LCCGDRGRDDIAADGQHERGPDGRVETIDDPVIRLRVLGSERVFDLATSDRWLLGSSSGCSLRLDDPFRRVSRRHAVASREGAVWTLTDLDSRLH
jgi:pSer/pThr/pTyr-binding forkhead associated (FHA) protein